MEKRNGWKRRYRKTWTYIKEENRNGIGKGTSHGSLIEKGKGKQTFSRKNEGRVGNESWRERRIEEGGICQKKRNCWSCYELKG